MSPPAGLARGIRRWDLVAVVINGIIGAGIFGLPSLVFARLGSYSLLAVAACALVVTLVIVCFGEVASRFSATGGPYRYAHEAFGPTAGFQVGWLLWLSRLTAFAANCNLLVDYLAFFWPGASVPAWRALIMTAIIAALTAANIRGVRNAARVSNVFTIAKLVPLLLFVGVGVFFVAPRNFSFGAAPGYGAFSASVLVLVYAFTGFELAVIPAGEVQDPRRNLPRAMLLAIGCVAVLYLLVQVVCIGTLPGLADSQRPLADASGGFLGRAGASLISAGAIVSIIGNLNVGILAGSRLPFAMSEAGELPRVLGVTHRRFRTPHAAILVTAGVMLALSLGSSFSKQVNLSVIAKLASYAVTCAALIVFRRRPDAPPAQFRAPAGTALAVLVLLLIGWLLSNATARDVRDSSIAAAAGLLLFLAVRGRRRREVPLP